MTVAAPSTETERSPEAVLDLLEKRAATAGGELASYAGAGEDVLHYLAVNGEVATRNAVAANPGAAPKTNLVLAVDREESVRANLAGKIGTLLPGLLTAESEHLRELTLATLDKLARDEAPAVRAILSEAIKTLDCVPKSVVQKLARDVEAIVALPVLEYSPLLDDLDLIEILAAARATDIFCAVARRKGLSEDASDAIVAKFDTRAVAVLVANETAKIRNATLDKIVVRAAGVPELHYPLVLRADLSAGLIRRIAAFVGAALIETLAKRHDLDDRTRAHLKSELKARVEAAAADDEEPNEDRSRPQKYDEAFVEAAADFRPQGRHRGRHCRDCRHQAGSGAKGTRFGFRQGVDRARLAGGLQHAHVVQDPVRNHASARRRTSLCARRDRLSAHRG